VPSSVQDADKKEAIIFTTNLKEKASSLNLSTWLPVAIVRESFTPSASRKEYRPSTAQFASKTSEVSFTLTLEAMPKGYTHFVRYAKESRAKIAGLNFLELSGGLESEKNILEYGSMPCMGLKAP
jgi:hypothetical protein